MKNFAIHENISVLLSDPEGAANLGYIARIMANTGFEKLIFNGNLSGREVAASRYAVNASRILDKALKVASFNELVSQTDVVIGFSPRNPWNDNRQISYDSFSEVVEAELKYGKTIGLLFGNESNGLTNDQLSSCKYRVAFPTEQLCPSMNLSHAVLVALWDLRTKLNSIKFQKEKTDFASLEQRTIFKNKLEEVISISGYSDGHNLQQKLLEISSAFDSKNWTEREMNMLTSLFGKLARELNFLKDKTTLPEKVKA